MPRPQFTLRALLVAFMWGKNGPPPGWTGQFSLRTLAYAVTAIAVLLAVGKATHGMDRADDICALVFFGFAGLLSYMKLRQKPTK